MIGMKAGWLILLGIMLGMFVWFGSGTALVIAAVLLLIPVCSFFIHLYYSPFLSVIILLSVFPLYIKVML